MDEKQIRSYRIVYGVIAAVFLLIFALTGRFLYIFFTSVCLCIAANPQMMKKRDR